MLRHEHGEGGEVVAYTVGKVSGAFNELAALLWPSFLSDVPEHAGHRGLAVHFIWKSHSDVHWRLSVILNCAGYDYAWKRCILVAQFWQAVGQALQSYCFHHICCGIQLNVHIENGSVARAAVSADLKLNVWGVVALTSIYSDAFHKAFYGWQILCSQWTALFLVSHFPGYVQHAASWVDEIL